MPAGLIRIYTKPKGRLPDYNEPVVLPGERCAIQNFCDRIHRQFSKQLKYALVWGSSAKHRPQKVGLDHVLQDEDIVQLVKASVDFPCLTLENLYNFKVYADGCCLHTNG